MSARKNQNGETSDYIIDRCYAALAESNGAHYLCWTNQFAWDTSATIDNVPGDVIWKIIPYGYSTDPDNAQCFVGLLSCSDSLTLAWNLTNGIVTGQKNEKYWIEFFILTTIHCNIYLEVIRFFNSTWFYLSKRFKNYKKQNFTDR